MSSTSHGPRQFIFVVFFTFGCCCCCLVTSFKKHVKAEVCPFFSANASRKTVREVLESNLSSEERAALENLSKRKDFIVKAAVKGGAFVVWRADLYQKKALRQLCDTSFHAKVETDVTSTNQQIAKSNINDLIVKQELPATATNLIITTPRTLCKYFLP